MFNRVAAFPASPDRSKLAGRNRMCQSANSKRPEAAGLYTSYRGTIVA